MNRHRHVIIVDGYSTGMFYIDLLQRMGMPAIHVRSIPESQDSAIARIADHALAATGDRYAALVDGSGDISVLVDRLMNYAPLAVLAGCESGVELADRLALRLGLSGNDPELGEASRDKYLMHRAVAGAGCRSLKSCLGSDPDEIVQWAQQSGLPVVVKPPRSSGADGVHVCNTLEEVRQAAASLIGFRSIMGDRITHVLAQEFAAGDEVVVNTVSCKGRHLISDLWRYHKLITADGRSVYDGAQLVQDFGEMTAATRAYAFSVLDALGIVQGPAHMEVMLTADGPVLIECGARPMGASYPQELLKESLGYTQLELALESYLDPEAFCERFQHPYRLLKHFFIKVLISTREGNLESVPGISLLASLPSVRSGNFLSCMEKDAVVRTVDLLSAPGSIFMCHEDEMVLAGDHAIIRELEEDAQNLLFALSPAASTGADPEWFKHIPDDQWLKTEEESRRDALKILKILEPVSGLKILDCPCGDARVSVHLAEKGALITGRDINPRFIEKASQRFEEWGLATDLQVLDMRKLAIESTFDVVLNWFNSLGYFDIETDFDVLKRMAKALVPGGILLLEAPNRTNAVANTRVKVDTNGKEFKKHWDAVSERMYIPLEMQKGGSEPTVIASAYLYSLAQFRLLFHLAGLELETVYNEHLEPFDDASMRMILIGRKPDTKDQGRRNR